jgi:hypothetical protein
MRNKCVCRKDYKNFKKGIVYDVHYRSGGSVDVYLPNGRYISYNYKCSFLIDFESIEEARKRRIEEIIK